MAATSCSVSPHSQSFASLVPKLVSSFHEPGYEAQCFQYLILLDPILAALKAWDEAYVLFLLRWLATFPSLSIHSCIFFKKSLSLHLHSSEQSDSFPDQLSRNRLETRYTPTITELQLDTKDIMYVPKGGMSVTNIVIFVRLVVE